MITPETEDTYLTNFFWLYDRATTCQDTDTNYQWLQTSITMFAEYWGCTKDEASTRLMLKYDIRSYV